jgi:protein-tyrosine-phosphatase
MRILILCSANICRSPSTGLLLQRLTNERHEILTAGIDAGHLHDVGDSLCQDMVEHLVRSDVPAEVVEGHRSSAVSRSAIEAADVILVMTREHRAAAVRLSPAAQRKTFLMSQAVRFSEWALNADPVEFPGSRSLLGWWDLARAHADFVEDADLLDAHQAQEITHLDVIPLVDISARVIARSLNAFA